MGYGARSAGVLQSLIPLRAGRRNVPRRVVSSSHGGAGTVAILSEPDNSDAALEKQGMPMLGAETTSPAE
jgi:hypothetical protein